MYPFWLINPESLNISLLFKSNFLSRKGSLLNIFPCSYGLICIEYMYASPFFIPA